MRKIRLFIVVIALLLGVSTIVSADNNIKVSLNGEYISFDQPPIMQDERVLVPIRAVFEAMGADVSWDGKSEIIGIIKNDIKIFMKIGENEIVKFVVADFEEYKKQLKALDKETQIKSITSDVAPQIINDRTLVPVRVISEAIGASVVWNESANTVVITCEKDFIAKKNTDKAFFNKFVEMFNENSISSSVN